MTRLCGSMVLLVLIAACGLCAGCTTAPGPNATPTPAPAATVTGSVPGTPGDTSVALALTARDIAFDQSTLAAPAGSTVALTFVNDDAGVPHNFALYTDSTAATPVFIGEIITGPATTTYTFTAPSQPGSYFFRCDPHPTVMTGSFVAT
jgi:plastocyanin